MHLIAIGWLYVVLMMAVAEALSSQGTVLGAVFTFLLYGLLPLGIVLYIVGTPVRKKALRLAEQRAAQAEAPPAEAQPVGDLPSAAPSQTPDRSRHATADAVAAERKEA